MKTKSISSMFNVCTIHSLNADIPWNPVVKNPAGTSFQGKTNTTKARVPNVGLRKRPMTPPWSEILCWKVTGFLE